MNGYIQLIKQSGFRVFIHPSKQEPTYCYFTDGKRIGYAQWSNSRVSVTSVHRPNTSTGTGFQISDEITSDTLNAAASCFAPWWASDRDMRSVVKYTDWDAFVRASAWNAELVEV